VAGYEVLGRVATTATGTVWKARDVALDRLVALKEVVPGSAVHEASALAALSSENVVRVFGVVDDGPRSFLVEEWVDGATLAAVLRSSGRLTPAQGLGVIRGALLGLAAAHRAGIVHGDVSASNILIDGSGTSKIIDFGSAARIGEQARASTGAFAAPETRSGAPITSAADVFSAAAVLAVLLHGRMDPTPSSRGVDEPIKSVLDVAMSTDPSQRYPDAAAFLAALEEAAQRRYGATWWSQAGIGALATSTAGVVVAAAEGSPFVSGAGHTAAATQLAAEPHAVASPPAVSLAAAVAQRGGRRRLLIGGSIAAVVLVGAAIAVAVSAGGEDKPSGAASSSSSTEPPGSVTSSSSPAPTASSPSALTPAEALSGMYSVRQTVTSTQGHAAGQPDARVGDVSVRKWVVTPACTGTSCTLTVTITGGSIRSVILHRTATGWAGVAHFLGTCVDNATGAVLNRVPRTLAYSVATPQAAGTVLPASFTGGIVDTGPPTANCPAIRVVKVLKLTRT